jgi:hypothetical protein
MQWDFLEIKAAVFTWLMRTQEMSQESIVLQLVKLSECRG